ncbi:uncharacterized protein AB675_154 [Cyphellophora attinorum]|uniref:Uncharacterized protein n=1 Tax=Cyphellophora attinorum TaxID=1664694 RepID=A0A0N0NKG1_9EURO|nr:uncharacterized protein AB675_154 [Phialophora attinorum]KPI37809.1 hypothetical protein AB675_154 [Phialophora attinorum]
MAVLSTTSPTKPTSKDIVMSDSQTAPESEPSKSQTTSTLETVSSSNSASASSSRQTTPITPDFPDLDFETKEDEATHSDNEDTTPTTAEASPRSPLARSIPESAEKDKTPLWTPEMRAELDRTWVASPAMAKVKKDVAKVLASRVPQWGLRSAAERRGA